MVSLTLQTDRPDGLLFYQGQGPTEDGRRLDYVAIALHSGYVSFRCVRVRGWVCVCVGACAWVGVRVRGWVCVWAIVAPSEPRTMGVHASYPGRRGEHCGNVTYFPLQFRVGFRPGKHHVSDTR